MNELPEQSDLLTLALEQIESGQETLDSFLAKHPQQAAELRPELEAALWLRFRKPALEARPGFLAGSRAHLLETLRTSPPQKKPGFWQRLFSSPLQRNPLLEALSLVTMIVCIAFVANNMRLMSKMSLPGEPLYSLKLSYEQTRLVLTRDPEEDARLQIEMAQQRTSEIVELILDRNYRALPQATADLEGQLQASLAALEELAQTNPAASQALSQAYEEDLTSESMILTILLDTSPPKERHFIELALQATARGLAPLQD